MHPEPVIRIALLDPQTIFREGLRSLIAREPDLEVVIQLASVDELDDGGAVVLDAPEPGASDPVAPNVVITDLVLPDASHDDVISRLRARFPDASIVALTALDDLATVRHVLAAGADGYVLKTATVADLFASIRTVAHGGLYLQPSIGIAFASRPPDETTHAGVGGLTPKETDVLRLLALGHTNAEIAQALGTSLRTIETHRAHIHQKLDLHTRAHLVRFALDVGLLRLDEEGTAAIERRAPGRDLSAASVDPARHLNQ